MQTPARTAPTRRPAALLFALALSLALGFTFAACDPDGGSTSGDTSGGDACSLEPDPGPCEAAFEKYFFDTEAGECASFSYGGCDGVVPFETLEDCQAACE